MGNLKLAHIIAIDKDSGEPVALVCDANGYVRVTLDTETVTVGGSVLPTGAATSAKQDKAKGVLDNIEAGIDELKAEIVLGARVTTTYDEYDQDTGEKSVLDASLDLDQLREQRTQMNAQIQQDMDRLNALRSDRDDIAAMIADINAVVSS